MDKTQVVLIDNHDTEIGIMEKNEAHIKGVLHRAVSVFIFNAKGEWLLQRRAFHKYHSPGEWSNTCCTHPFPNESYLAAAKRRLSEEMGLSPTIEEEFRTIYKAELGNGMIEHEYDTVFIGYSDQLPEINPDEIAEYKYVSTQDLDQDIQLNPNHYTLWFRKFYPRIQEVITEKVV